MPAFSAIEEIAIPAVVPICLQIKPTNDATWGDVASITRNGAVWSLDTEENL